jgi:hypothetical protein
VADPADDLAWPLAVAPHESVDLLVATYQRLRGGASDPRLEERALLVGELALARWLLHGARAGDRAVVADAEAMLADLANALVREA